jgi:hypothetical protein
MRHRFSAANIVAGLVLHYCHSSARTQPWLSDAPVADMISASLEAASTSDRAQNGPEEQRALLQGDIWQES